MYLQDHPALEFMLLKFFMQFHHRQLDHICGSSLYGRIDGISLCKTAYRKVGGVYVAQPALATHQRLNKTIFTAEINSVIHILLYAGELLFVVVDYLFGF